MGTLAPLALLACPIGMGLMMWVMMRGNRHSHAEPKELSVTELQAEHRRLEAQLARAERRAVADELALRPPAGEAEHRPSIHT